LILRAFSYAPAYPIFASPSIGCRIDSNQRLLTWSLVAGVELPTVTRTGIVKLNRKSSELLTKAEKIRSPVFHRSRT